MRFLSNVLIAVAWMSITGRFGPADFLAGFVLGTLAVMIIDNQPVRYGRRLVLSLWFFVTYAWDVARSNAAIAWDVLSPRRRASPALIAVDLPEPLDGRARLLLVCLVAMTPGTIPVDFVDNTLHVHAYFGGDPDSVREAVQEYARRVAEVWS